jgi:RimJ/RimL family protein N-acetyltransferase
MVDEDRKADANRSVAILAYDGDRLAGYATLHHDEVLWTRHVGEIRTNVGADYRGIRLGARLVEEMFAIAKEIGLKKITANMTSDQKAARATFERIGFRPEALLADHVAMPRAHARHVTASYDDGLTTERPAHEQDRRMPKAE